MTKITMTLQNKVLNRIKTENLRPTPKKYFLARDFVTWCLVGAFFAAISLGFGMIIFGIQSADLVLFEKLGFSTSKKVISSIPFFWIAATISIATVAFVNFRNTRKGYKTTAKQFVFIASMIAIALGSVVYALNISRKIDNIASNLPLYNSVTPLNTNTWFDPDHGLLSGVVRERKNPEDFILRDADGELWHVTGDIALPNGFTFASGDWIKLIGKKTGHYEFEAIEARPWETPRAKQNTE